MWYFCSTESSETTTACILSSNTARICLWMKNKIPFIITLQSRNIFSFVEDSKWTIGQKDKMQAKETPQDSYILPHGFVTFNITRISLLPTLLFYSNTIKALGGRDYRTRCKIGNFFEEIIWEKEQFEAVDLGHVINKIRFKSLFSAFRGIKQTPYIAISHAHALNQQISFLVQSFRWRPNANFSLGSCVACSRLSVSENDRKSERAKSGISGERDPGEKRRGGSLLFPYQTPLVARSLFQSSTDREPGTG